MLQNEHDSLITDSAIPQEAVDKAAVAAGMKYAVLDEKSFVQGSIEESKDPNPLRLKTQGKQQEGHEGTRHTAAEEQEKRNTRGRTRKRGLSPLNITNI